MKAIMMLQLRSHTAGVMAPHSIQSFIHANVVAHVIVSHLGLSLIFLGANKEKTVRPTKTRTSVRQGL